MHIMSILHNLDKLCIIYWFVFTF